MSDERFLQIAEELQPDERELLERAYHFAESAHDGQKRKSGEPYFIHPTAVACRLWDKYKDLELTIAGLLHDTVEDNKNVHIQDIYEQFGKEIGFLVDATSKNLTKFYQSNVEIKDKIERLLWAGMQDVRVLLIKLSDREHNLSSLKHLKTDKQVRIAFETQAIYEPLKEILEFQAELAISEIAEKFTDYLTSQKITTPEELKRHLYSKFFRAFNHELYDLVYNNTDKVVWEIEDKNCFEEMLQNRDFEKHANIHCLWTDGTKFKALFTFDTGYIVDPTAALRVASYKS